MVTTGYGGNPDDPIAWGANSYEKLYNWIWFYNGYHPGHHFPAKSALGRECRPFTIKSLPSGVPPACA